VAITSFSSAVRSRARNSLYKAGGLWDWTKAQEEPMQKPYVTLRVEADYVPYEVFVNGGFVATDLSGWTGTETWPINSWLRSGDNQIALLLYPWHPEDDVPPSFDTRARLTLKVSVRDLALPDGPEHEITTLCFDGSKLESGDVTAESAAPGERGSSRVGPIHVEQVDFDGKLLIKRDLNLAVPFPEWAFLRSDAAAPAYTLSEDEIEPQYRQLLSAYENIWQLLQAKSLDQLMPLFAERSHEIDSAMYLPEGTTQAKLRASFEKTLHDETRNLAPLRPEEGAWKYDVGPTGRLLRLSDGAQSSAIIRFPEKSDPRASTGYAITFRKQGDQFFVAR
jgi:hypothetical protein